MRLILPSAVDQYLAQHHVMTLATQGDDGPWAAAVFYARDGDDLVFLSSPGSRHSRNLALQPRCAVTIQGDATDWRQIRGIQAEGLVRQASGADLVQARACYERRFAFVRPQSAAPALASALARVHWYRLQIRRLHYIDNQRGFGQRQQFEPDGRD